VNRFWAIAAALAPWPAAAQDAPQFEASVVSDDRRRGLSWSDGRAAAQLRLDAPLPAGFDASLRAATARGAARHGDADAALDLRLGYRRDSGLWRLEAGAVAHTFAGGRGDQDFWEVEAGAGVTVGPLDLALLAAVAPRQQAIGGSNFYRRARLRSGVPGTPMTLSAHLGRSTGSRRDPTRTGRLRPDGNYYDWALGADYALGKATLSLTYSDTDIDGASANAAGTGRHSGATLVAGAHVAF